MESKPDKKKRSDGERVFIFFVAMLLYFPAYAYSAFCYGKVWQWFAVEHLGAPTANRLQIMAALFLFNSAALICYRVKDAKIGTETISMPFIKPTVTLAFGSLLHWWFF